MKRRDFIKGALLSTAVVAASAGKIFAEAGGQHGGMDMNRLKNPESPSALEQKHVPGIDAPATVKSGEWFDVRVKVGFMQEHPSTSGHWITMIKLLADGNEVAETDFKSGGISAPYATFRIRLEKSSTIEAVENCNLHGAWASQPVSITVS
ncbi:MAG: desulfoferrodoxin family protein [Nitrospirota bacterium]